MATNNFLAFCPTNTGTNLLTQVEYAGATDRDVGNQPGIASAKLNNKALRQSNVIASQLAQYIADKTGLNMLDNDDLSTILANMVVAFAPTTQEYDITNLTLATAVGTNALTISVKTKAGTNASATDPITVGMRSNTLTSGVYLTRSITGALSAVISSGSTLGQVSAQPSVIYVYLLDNAGTLEIAYSHAYYPENGIISTTAEGGAGGADSASLMYSTTARSNVAFRYIGYILNTQATAGTWASAGTQVQLGPFQGPQVPTFTKITSGSGTYYPPAGCKSIRARFLGGGGGGGGGGSGSGSNGGDTTFGPLTAGGGGGAPSAGPAGGGGSASLGSLTVGVAIDGGFGVTAFSSSIYEDIGGNGGSSALGGAGGGADGHGTNGGSGASNSGSGGGGGGTAGSARAGGGGGSGAYVEVWLGTDPTSNPLLASYAYGIGAGGGGGSGSDNGGAGGSGVALIEEFY